MSSPGVTFMLKIVTAEEGWHLLTIPLHTRLDLCTTRVKEQM